MTDDYRSFAIDLARRAGDIMATNFSLGVNKTWKQDNTPLTVTDLMINEMVLKAVAEAFPDHGVLAEEGNSKNVRAKDTVWMCDPIDGTVPFSHGIPTFTFSLALVHEGRSQLGVVFDPLSERMFVAERNKGAFLDDERISVSPVTTLDSVVVDFEDALRKPPLRSDARERLQDKGVLVQTLWSSVYGGSLVACGQHAATVCSGGHAWDLAALAVLVEEAGGRVTDIDGNQPVVAEPINGFIASNGDVHDAILDALHGE